MTTNTMTSPLSMTSHFMPTTDHGIGNGADHTEAPHHEEDDRSSSLSEIGERADHDEAENAFHDGSDANDTEAETERLEDSPQKLQNHRNVVLTSTDALYEVRSSPLAMSVLPLMVADNGKSNALMSSLAELIASQAHTRTPTGWNELRKLARLQILVTRMGKGCLQVHPQQENGSVQALSKIAPAIKTFL